MNDWTEHEPLLSHTTLQVGGPADFFVTARTEDELVTHVRAAHARSIPVTVLGGGSNVLVSDAGIRGLVIENAIPGIEAAEDGDMVLVTAGAGVVFDDLVAHTVAAGWWGLENLSHIPGSVGATPIQNVGAYGVEIAALVASVRAFDTNTNAFVELTPAQCVFGYRDSLFKRPDGKRYIVTSVTFRLSKSPTPILSYKDLAARFADAKPSQQDIRDAVIEIRSKKFPDWHTVGTAGSFFKNPIIPIAQYDELKTQYPELPSFPVDDTQVKVPLGWILDRVIGVRGVREGSVGAYEGQALVIVNYGGATARDIDAFASAIERDVLAATGITIEREVTRLGEHQ